MDKLTPKQKALANENGVDILGNLVKESARTNEREDNHEQE